MHLQVMQRISTKSRIYLNNKNKNPSIFLFTVCLNWNATHIVLPSKKIQKRDIIRMILAVIYMHSIDMNYSVRLVFRVNNQGIGINSFIYKFRFRQYILYYLKKKNFFIVYTFQIDVNIRRFNQCMDLNSQYYW